MYESFRNQIIIHLGTIQSRCHHHQVVCLVTPRLIHPQNWGRFSGIYWARNFDFEEGFGTQFWASSELRPGKSVDEGGQAEVEHLQGAVEPVFQHEVLPGRPPRAVELDEGKRARSARGSQLCAIFNFQSFMEILGLHF